MEPASYPDATRLVYRIRAALKGESTGQEAAKLAWQFAKATDRANSALEACAAAIDAGNPLEAALLEALFPNLLETVSSLDFEQWDAWTARCQTFAWRQPAKLDTERAQNLATALEAVENPKDWLYQDYRDAVRRKDKTRAWRVISAIADKHPDDPNAQEEAKRRNKALSEQAEKEIAQALADLIPVAPPAEIVADYRRQGILLASKSSIDSALDAERASRLAKIEAQVSALPSPDAFLANSETWQEVETSYLAVNYTLAITESRGDISSELRERFEKLGGHLARIRSAHESDISIRQAIAELQLPSRGTRADRKRPSRIVERLSSLESQAKRMGRKISPELQKELNAAYALARRQRMPRWIALYGGAATVLIAAIWIGLFLIGTFKGKRQDKELLIAIQTAQNEGSYQTAKDVLAEWTERAADTNPDTPLARSAASLQAWVKEQDALADNYRETADAMEAMLTASYNARNQARFDGFVTAALHERELIAPDLSQDTESRIETARASWNQLADETTRTLNETLRDRSAALAQAVEAAQNADTAQTFQDARNRALALGAEINATLQVHSYLPAARDLRQSLADIEPEFETMSAKWSALDNEIASLGDAKSADEYLERLQRIHSFDILRVGDKANIEQSLRLKSAIGAMKQKLLLPDDDQARQELSAGAGYLRDAPGVDAEERAYLQRLIDDPVFKNVYVSHVQYFEGESKPRNEYRTLLVEPIAKSDTPEGDPNLSFSFRARGFNEQGEPESKAQDMRFLSRSDGTFWGFFYKPSELCPESKYFEQTLVTTLRSVLAGAPRFTLISLHAQLDEQTTLAPAFRAYWQLQIIDFMRLHPWKWGLPLAPSLSQREAALERISSGEITNRLWLSSIEQTVPSFELVEYFEKRGSGKASLEAEALATFYELVLQGEFALAGHVTAEGIQALRGPELAGEPLWTVDASTGSITKLTPERRLVPYAPVLQYRFENGGRDALFKKARFLTGLDLTEPRYADALPAMFR